MIFTKLEYRGDILDIEALKQYACANMSEKRYVHTLGVEHTCEELGKVFLPEPLRKYLMSSALLHDITKELTYDEQLILSKKFGIMLKDADLLIPKALHSRTGAVVAQQLCGAPEEVYHAISGHTTGAEDMDTFGKLLYLADCIEPNRRDSECVSLRKYFFKKMKKADTEQARNSLVDKAMLISLDNTIKYLLKKNKFIHPDSVATRNQIIGSGYIYNKS